MGVHRIHNEIQRAREYEARRANRRDPHALRRHKIASEIRAEIRAASAQGRIWNPYRKPFVGIMGYVYDDGNMVADNFEARHDRGGAIRGRGWGRLQYLDRGAEIFDACDALIREITAGVTDVVEAAKLLNEQWPDGPLPRAENG